MSPLHFTYVALLCIMAPAVVLGGCSSCVDACNDPDCSSSSLFYCYNRNLGTCIGRPLGYGDRTPKWCAFDCTDGLVLYYDCELGSQPQCPPSSSHTNQTAPTAADLSEGFNTDQDTADVYITNAQSLDKSTRQQGYTAAVNAIVATAFSTGSPAPSPVPVYTWEFELDLDNATTTAQLRTGLSKLHLYDDTTAAVNQALTQYILELASTPFGMELARAGNLQGFFDFCKSVVKAVGSVIHKAYDFCTSGDVQKFACEEVGKSVACTVSTFFGFPLCFDSPLAEFKRANPSSSESLTTTGYEPICLSKCQSCMEYVVPGYNDFWCKYDDYKTMPNEGLCLQSCPTETTRELLGFADSINDCWSLCEI